MKYIIELTKKQIAMLIGQNKDKSAKKGRPSKFPKVEDIKFFDSPKAQGRIVITLTSNGINTAKQLAACTKVELLRLTGIGNISIKAIETVLSELGLKLKK